MILEIYFNTNIYQYVFVESIKRAKAITGKHVTLYKVDLLDKLSVENIFQKVL